MLTQCWGGGRHSGSQAQISIHGSLCISLLDGGRFAVIMSQCHCPLPQSLEAQPPYLDTARARVSDRALGASWTLQSKETKRFDAAEGDFFGWTCSLMASCKHSWQPLWGQSQGARGDPVAALPSGKFGGAQRDRGLLHTE